MSPTQTKTKESKVKVEDLTPGFISPELVVKEFGVRNGDKVADLGCGGGYFTIPLAYLVGEKGKVYAVDVMEGPVESVRSKAYLEKLDNIETIRSDIEKRGSLEKWIKAGECQYAVLANTLYTSKKKKGMLEEADRILEKKGKLIVIDWVANVSGAFKYFGPPIELRVTEKEAKDIIKKAGFTFVESFNAGQFHFGMVFKKK